ncbi:hypothetical protein [Roseovarius aestuarii]|uniref:HEAT repeat domain-containing protein n=1 Tax=Roseovarius aestuarii TaxID=475083 RepID=A0A1X7BYX9_9RHOB|nr:hypothetical protein [Roseovarius aestuarii]SMC14720.1 hypothetical protein ROA7745_04590 [Roseovarius aestuarii]
MQQEKDTGTEHPPFRPSGGGILALLDAPEGDAGVLAEARFYGEEGCEELLAAVGPGSNLDLERKARGVHLLGLLGCKKLIGLSQDLLKEGLFPVEVSLVYALARIDRSVAEQEFAPIIEKDDPERSFLREHAMRALWVGASPLLKQKISKALQATNDKRLFAELPELLLTPAELKDECAQGNF